MSTPPPSAAPPPPVDPVDSGQPIDPVDPVDPVDFKRAMGRFATGVTVVTTFAGKHDHAMTASSVTSVSLEPVLVALSADQDGRWLDAVQDSGCWGVSVLGISARATADWLSTPGRPLHGQLDRIAYWRGPATGVALLEGALAALECRTAAIHPAGDHSLVIGEVVSVHTPDRAEAALVRFRGRFGALP